MSEVPWGLQIMAAGMGMVFAMLLLLMISLLIVTALDKPDSEKAVEADEDEAIEAAPAAAAAAAPVAAAAAATTAEGDMSEAELAAIAVAIHTAQSGLGGSPALVANQSGAGLTESRWVAVGRSMQNTSWQRS